MSALIFPPVQVIREAVRSCSNREFENNIERADLSYHLNRYTFPMKYFQSRLNNLGFMGTQVFDAGCGSGAWSIALSQCYRNVVSRDSSNEGLNVFRAVLSLMDVSNIQLDHGTLEALPYPNILFDDVFCYSVIMYCDIEAVLSEFLRILKPGGRVYLCLNSDAYYYYLIHERGKAEPEQAEYGKKVLYNTFWKRFIKNTDDGRVDNLRELVLKWCGSDWLSVFERDLAKFSDGKVISVSGYETRAYTYDEIEQLAGEMGFVNFRCATEGMLHLNHTATPMEPLYHGYYNGKVTVWECVLEKPI